MFLFWVGQFIPIVGVICKCHLRDMPPDIRYLYEEGLADVFVYGAYDGCVDMVFQYDEQNKGFCKSPMSVDTIKHWAIFQPEAIPKPDNNNEKEWKRLPEPP